MPDLTNAEKQQFQAALLSAFRQASSYEPLTQFGLERPLNTLVTLPAPLGKMVFQLIDELDANDEVRPFLREARKQNTGNPLLKAFEQAYLGAREPAHVIVPPLDARLRRDLVAAFSEVPALHSKDKRDELLGAANISSLNRSEFDPRADLELIVDQVPSETLASMAARASTLVAAFNPGLARRLAALAGTLRTGFQEAVPAEPLVAEPNVEPEALLVSGVDERKPRRFLVQAQAVGRSVAYVEIPRFFTGVADGQRSRGTAWLLGSDLLITNYHVVDARDRRSEPRASPDDFKRQALAAEVRFDFFDDTGPVRKAGVAELVASDEALDYALLRVDVVPDAAERRPLRVALTSPTLRVGDRLNIVQHGGGRPQTYAMRNNFFTESEATRLRYMTDTEEGASGSPVCDDDWRVVGLHHAAKPIAAKPITSLDLVGSRVVRYYNEGVFLGAILAHIKTQAPAAHAAIVAANAP